MADQDVAFENRNMRMKGPLGPKKMILLRAEVEEGLSQVGKSDVQFISPDHDIKMGDIVGKRMSLEVDDDDGNTRHWQGYCSHCAYEGKFGSQALYRAEIRPTLWFLSLGYDCQIFQELSALEVIMQVLKDAKVTDIKDSTTATYAKRDYIVQYRETDLDFISRLMEEEGIYYFFTHDGTKDTMVLADSSSAHKKMENGADKLEFHFKEDGGYQRDKDHIFDWKSAEAVRTGKVTMTDYDFEHPTSDLKAITAMPKGSHSFKDIDYYDYPGHHLTADEGKTRTKILVESFAAGHNRSRGIGNVRWLAAGGTFTMDKHPRAEFNKEYLVLSARHMLNIETDSDKQRKAEAVSDNRTDINSGNAAPAGSTRETKQETTPAMSSEFTVQLKENPFRAPRKTPWPRISGLQTAVVTGKSGEEIYTDKYGRVKVQFHWDREGKKDEKTSCFVRVMQHMSGQGWGAFHIPRMGQEVVVQFEDGNPDRPIIIGMLYNEAKKHPFEFPANMTQSGIKTNSSKGGGGFHELVFEDKKDEEFVRLQSEKDYKETIKNNAEISIGFEKKDPGDLTEKIYHHKTTELETGDHTFSVKDGKEVKTIAKTRELTVGEDETISIGAKETITVGSDREETVGGKEKITISGDREETVGGKENIAIGGDMIMTVGGKFELDAGSDILIKSGSKITLEVGGTTVVIDSSSVTIDSTSITANASGSFEASGSGSATVSSDGSLSLSGSEATFEGSASATVKSSGILTVQGSLVKIN